MVLRKKTKESKVKDENHGLGNVHIQRSISTFGIED